MNYMQKNSSSKEYGIKEPGGKGDHHEVPNADGMMKWDQIPFTWGLQWSGSRKGEMEDACWYG